MIARWIVAALTTAPAALADDDFTELSVMQRVHGELDRNGDGVIDREEYTLVSEADGFDDLDRDQDGHISVGELQDWVMLTPPRPHRNVALKPLAAPVANPAPAQPTGMQQGNPLGNRSTASASAPAATLGRSAGSNRLPASAAARAPTPLELVAILSALVGLGTLVGGLWRVRSARPARRRKRR